MKKIALLFIVILCFFTQFCDSGGKDPGDADDPGGSSGNSVLSSLLISSGSLSFLAGKTDYLVSVEEETVKVRVTPTAKETSAVIAVNNLTVASGTLSQEISLNYGSNTIRIVVTYTKDGKTETTTYTITVIRNSAQPDVYLSSLILTGPEGQLTFPFQNNSFNYNVVVDYQCDGITATPVSNPGDATITVNSGGEDEAVASGNTSREIPLAYGSNTLTVKVSSLVDSTMRTTVYTINITREDLPADISLSNITVTGCESGNISVPFNRNVTEYEITTTFRNKTVTLVPQTESTVCSDITVNGETVESGHESADIVLDVGENTINVILAALYNGSAVTTEYTVKITRLDGSNDAYLSNISLSSSSGTIPLEYYRMNKYIYKRTIDADIESVTVNFTKNEAHASWEMKVNGLDVSPEALPADLELQEGDNNIEITVTSENENTEMTYSIRLLRAGKNWYLEGDKNCTFNDMTVGSDGNIFIVGYIYNGVSQDSSNDMWIRKFNPDGTEDMTHWNKKIDNNKENDMANLVALDSERNVYVVGRTEDLISPSSGYDLWIKKFDVNGVEDAAWEKKIEDVGAPFGVHSIAIDSKDRLYLLQYFKSPEQRTIHRLDTKLNSAPELVLSFTDCAVQSMAIDSEDNILIFGCKDKAVSDNTGRDWIIKKFDEDGIEITEGWDKQLDYGSSVNCRCDNNIRSMILDSENNVYLSGIDSVYDNKDIFIGSYLRIAKFYANGSQTWSVRYDYLVKIGGEYSSDRVMTFDMEGNLILGCYTDNPPYYDDCTLKKYNPSDGAEITDPRLNIFFGTENYNYVYSLRKDSSGGIYALDKRSMIRIP